MSLDTCSWYEVDNEISLLLARVESAKKYMENKPRPLRKHDSDWLDVLSTAHDVVSQLSYIAYDLYTYAKK